MEEEKIREAQIDEEIRNSKLLVKTMEATAKPIKKSEANEYKTKFQRHMEEQQRLEKEKAKQQINPEPVVAEPVKSQPVVADPVEPKPVRFRLKQSRFKNLNLKHSKNQRLLPKSLFRMKLLNRKNLVKYIQKNLYRINLLLKMFRMLERVFVRMKDKLLTHSQLVLRILVDLFQVETVILIRVMWMLTKEQERHLVRLE